MRDRTINDLTAAKAFQCSRFELLVRDFLTLRWRCREEFQCSRLELLVRDSTPIRLCLTWRYETHHHEPPLSATLNTSRASS